MRFLADMGVSKRVTHWLRAQGHDVAHLLEEGLNRLPDPAVFAKAADEDRIVLTFDLDFGEIAARIPQASTSIVVLRLHDTRSQHVIARLGDVLPRAEGALASGAIVVVEETRFRVRTLPIGG